MIAIVIDNQITNTGDIKDLFPNTLFPNTGVPQAFKAENNIVDVVNSKSYDENTEHLETADPYLEDGVVYSVRVVTNSDEYNAERISGQWVRVRSERDQFLVNSDWTQLPDVSNVDKSAWATYRQQLRDITNQADPFNITWPTEPN